MNVRAFLPPEHDQISELYAVVQILGVRRGRETLS